MNKIKSVLQSLGAPVARLIYKGPTVDTYITYQLIYRENTNHQDDEKSAQESLYRADIYAKSDYTELLKSMIEALEQAGYYGIAVNAEAYEKDTELFHVPIEFYDLEEF